jgi:NAD(P)-dependent dehydrogenase (short-subunit alcohol dehydrogenase family)
VDMRALIMGGTSGIGLATAERLTADGVEVTVTGRDAARLDAVRDRVAGAEQVDGADRAAVSAFLERFGSFAHLVLAFSPGSVGLGSIREISQDDFEAAVTGKLFAYVDVIRQAQVTGSITMISAASGHSASAGVVALSAANGAIERIVAPLAAELAPVRVNAVSPGVIDTPWWTFVPEDRRPAQFAEWVGELPVSRVGTGADVAEAVGYLVGATYVTGTIMAVDGGMTMA